MPDRLRKLTPEELTVIADSLEDTLVVNQRWGRPVSDLERLLDEIRDELIQRKHRELRLQLPA